MGAEHSEEHVEVGEYLKSFIYGGLDGTINILVVIITAVFSNMSNSKIVAMAVAISIGDAIGMGLGDYLSYRSEQKFVLTEREREQYEFEHMREEELAEMVALLREFGYDGQQGKRLTELYASKEETFINIMMLMELGLVVNHVEAWKIGCINFGSFLSVSLLPLLPFILSGPSSDSAVRLVVAVAVGGVQLFSLGYIKGEVIRAGDERKRESGVEILVFGVVVVIIGYVVGNIFES